MKYRFFKKTIPSGKSVKLFVLAIDEEKEELHEYLLSDGKLNETSELMKIMIDGFQNIDEIDEDEASSEFKDMGFDDAIKNLGEKDG
jgi:F0F1-type ATP synthase epsilon subunit